MRETYHPNALRVWSLPHGETVIFESHGFQFVIEKIVLAAITADHVEAEE